MGRSTFSGAPFHMGFLPLPNILPLTISSLASGQKERKQNRLEIPNFYSTGPMLQWPTTYLGIEPPISKWKKKITKTENIVTELEID